MTLDVRRSTASLWALCMGLLAASSARGETPLVVAEETRDFEITVRDKPVGTNRIKITEMNDGATIVTTDVDLKCDLFFYTYGYELRGRETWQGNQLAQVDNRGVDNGTNYVVRAQVDPRGATIEAPGKAAARGPLLSMTTNFWRAPVVAPGKAAFLDVDKGTVMSSTVEPLEPEEVTVAGAKLNCSHYRLRGDVRADLWFDGRGRLVRQRTVEVGFPIEIRLLRVVAQSAPLARR